MTQSQLKELMRQNEAKRKEIKLAPIRKRQIEQAVDRVVEQYGETLKLLAKE